MSRAAVDREVQASGSIRFRACLRLERHGAQVAQPEVKTLGVADLIDDARKIGRDIDEGFVACTEIAATLNGFRT